jgi:hypothetical protein
MSLILLTVYWQSRRYKCLVITGHLFCRWGVSNDMYGTNGQGQYSASGGFYFARGLYKIMLSRLDYKIFP